jgi:hypothetical protein
VPLAFTAGSGTLSVQTPANANLAPPGHYMLFILNTNGVPSVASTCSCSSDGLAPRARRARPRLAPRRRRPA